MTLKAPSVPVLATTAVFVCLLGAQRLSRAPIIVAAPFLAPVAVAVVPAPEAEPIPSWPAALHVLEPSHATKEPLLHTEIPKRPRKEIVTYRVVGGDTIIGIAKYFGTSPETILWANDRVELNPEFLRIGQELIIPQTTGVLHEVKAGDKVEVLAQRYKVTVSAIVNFEYNHLAPPYTLTPGQKVMVPGGERPYQPRVIYGYSGPIPANVTRGTGRFVTPMSGRLTQVFWTGHRGIDIGAPQGSRVLAADSGFVVRVASDTTGYGRHVVINHGNGFETLYAHLSVILVAPGQSVRRGQAIGLSGNTGRSTGPHLHFEIRYFGVQYNPFRYLP